MAVWDALLSKVRALGLTHAYRHENGGADEVNLAGMSPAAVLASLFDANTVLKADSDNTPIALAVAASRILGRKSSGGIAALTAAEVSTLLSLTDYVTKALFDANTILAANSDDTPVALAVAASRILGRKSSGNIAAMTAAETLTLLGVTVMGQGARARRTTDQNIASGGAVAIVFDTEDYDNDGMWEGVTNPDRVTIQTSGIYLVIGQVHWEGPSNDGYRITYLSHSVAGYIAQSIVYHSADTMRPFSQTVSTWECTAGQYFRLLVFHDKAPNLDVKADGVQAPSLQVIRIGP